MSTRRTFLFGVVSSTTAGLALATAQSKSFHLSGLGEWEGTVRKALEKQLPDIRFTESLDSARIRVRLAPRFETETALNHYRVKFGRTDTHLLEAHDAESRKLLVSLGVSPGSVWAATAEEFARQLKSRLAS
jgi:hypothetical protein